MNLDIYVSDGGESDKKISHGNPTNFNTTLPLYIGTCPKDVNITSIENIKILLYQGYEIDKRSSVYYNIR